MTLKVIVSKDGKIYPDGAGIPNYYILRRQNGAITFHVGALGDLSKVPPAIPAAHLGPHRVTITDDGSGAVMFDRDIDIHYWNSQWTYRPAPLAVIKTPAKIVADNRMFIFGKVPGMQKPNLPARVPYINPMDTSGITTYMPTTGERRDIGLVTDPGAFAMMGDSTADLIDWGLAGGSCPIHFRDEATGLPINLLKNKANAYDGPGSQPGYWCDKGPAIPPSGPDPTAPGYDNGSGGYHVYANGHWTAQAAHFCEMSYLAHQFTGDMVFLEDLQYEANFLAFGDGRYDAQGRPIATGEYRGIAWILRSLFMAHTATKDAEDAGILPSTCLPSSYFKSILDASLEFWSAKSIDNPDPSVQTFRLVGGPSRFGPWQHYYMMLALSFGILTGHADWAPMYLWCLGNVIAMTNGTSSYPAAYGGAYYLNTVRGGGDGWDPARGPQPADWGKKFLSFGESFADMQLHGNDPWAQNPTGLTDAEYQQLVAHPLIQLKDANGNLRLAGAEYTQNAHAVLVAASYLELKGFVNVRKQYPEMDSCIGNVERFLAGSTFNARMSIVNDKSAAPVVITPIPDTPPPPPPPAPADPGPAQPPPATGGTMTVIVQGQGYILKPRIDAPPGAIHYGVKPGSWKLAETDQATLTPQGDAQATAKIAANVDTTAEKLHVQCDVFTDAAKTKTLTLAVALDDVLVEATGGGFDITPAPAA